MKPMLRSSCICLCQGMCGLRFQGFRAQSVKVSVLFRAESVLDLGLKL